jgi:hypothetical protein
MDAAKRFGPGGAELMDRLLRARGFESRRRRARFCGRPGRSSKTPFRMPGMRAAAERIDAARRSGRVILGVWRITM